MTKVMSRSADVLGQLLHTRASRGWPAVHVQAITGVHGLEGKPTVYQFTLYNGKPLRLFFLLNWQSIVRKVRAWE